MFRAIIAGFVAVALQLAALSAPLFHAHLDDRHDHHHGAAGVHAHMGGHERAHLVILGGDGPAVAEGDDGERVTVVQLFVAAEPSPGAIPAPAPLRFTLPAPPESIVPSTPRGLHSHDPPSRQSGPSRAPPPFLS